MYQKILVPLDGSQRAEKMLPFVEELAQKFGSQLVLLQVVDFKLKKYVPSGWF